MVLLLVLTEGKRGGGREENREGGREGKRDQEEKEKEDDEEKEKGNEEEKEEMEEKEENVLVSLWSQREVQYLEVVWKIKEEERGLGEED